MSEPRAACRQTLSASDETPARLHHDDQEKKYVRLRCREITPEHCESACTAAWRPVLCRADETRYELSRPHEPLPFIPLFRTRIQPTVAARSIMDPGGRPAGGKIYVVDTSVLVSAPEAI